METIKLLMIGDVVGGSGRAIFQRHIKSIKEKHAIDMVVVNGENSAHGVGITPRIVQFFKEHDVDVLTSGNHVWHKKEILHYLSTNTDLLRPANYPTGVPGIGYTIVQCKNHAIGVINLQGRVFMREDLDCPFRVADTILTYMRTKTKLIFVDFHAEATSEKEALATYLDGRITGFFGTHTHVQTADEQVLPKGTAYISDVGMAGAVNSLLGMQAAPIIQRFLTQMPVRFSVEMQPPYKLNAAIVTADTETGKALSIERINVLDDRIADTQEIREETGKW